MNVKKYINTTELAEMLNLKRNTIERWRTNRECPFSWIKVGGRVLYDCAEVQSYLENNKRSAVNNIQNKEF